MTLAFEAFYNQKEIDAESFYKKKIEPTTLKRVFPTLQKWNKMLITYKETNLKDQYLSRIKDMKTSDQLYKEWGKYYSDGAFSGKTSKQILEQNNININDIKENMKKNLSPWELRYIDDAGDLITNIAMIRRVRADLEGNDPERLENFKKWLDEQENRDTGRLRKIGIDVNKLNLEPIYP
jgi:hypothetical protein